MDQLRLVLRQVDATGFQALLHDGLSNAYLRGSIDADPIFGISDGYFPFFPSATASSMIRQVESFTCRLIARAPSTV